MARLTDIKPTKRPDRYSIYVDGKFAFALSDLELSNSKLSIGLELTEQEVADWKSEAARSKLRTQVLNYLAIRPRSNWEVVQYLQRKGYEPVDIDYAVGYSTDLGYLDDLAFAKSWVEYRQGTTPRSRLKLATELRAKGIGREVIDEVLGGEDREAQMKALQAVVTKKRRLYGDDRKLIDYCIRQGFPLDLVREVVRGDEV